MSGTTIGIIIAVVVIIAILVYVFKDKIFSSKGRGGGQPPVPPMPPSDPMI